MDHSEKIVQFFEENFNEKKCHELCRQTGFIQRSTSKLKGHEFIKTMVIPSQGLSTDSLKGLCKRMREYNPDADLSSQALCERINDISSSILMKRFLSKIIGKVHELIKIECPDLVKGLEKCNRILLQDSTVAVLNERLENAYQGASRGNNCVKSQVKKELSSVKVVQYLMRGHEFCKAMVNSRLEEFFEQMEKDILRMLLKDKRQRKTMFERVRDQETYYGIQEFKNECVA